MCLSLLSLSFFFNSCKCKAVNLKECEPLVMVCLVSVCLQPGDTNICCILSSCAKMLCRGDIDAKHHHKVYD